MDKDNPALIAVETDEHPRTVSMRGLAAGVVSSPIENQKSEIVSKRRHCDVELTAMLDDEPLLCERLREALATQRWLVTVHCKLKDAPPDDLASNYVLHDFPAAETVGVMQQTCRTILADQGSQIEVLKAAAGNANRWR